MADLGICALISTMPASTPAGDSDMNSWAYQKSKRNLMTTALQYRPEDPGQVPNVQTRVRLPSGRCPHL